MSDSQLRDFLQKWEIISLEKGFPQQLQLISQINDFPPKEQRQVMIDALKDRQTRESIALEFSQSFTKNSWEALATEEQQSLYADPNDDMDIFFIIVLIMLMSPLFLLHGVLCLLPFYRCGF